ncbi:hypothetical protein [Amycolatopsis sp. PS_44_ISF1]|uniref:hypothetical protein n=1 Tax=Amycolatopsis sp. PS_44_ISF1 TaxID=2974917 RepID=UPI0028E0372B|nr:hypothetical protein [Amycolatopsis sp. PS_44_ISF1]MDT8912637.1 hypothetical protein [Amycolatopsis sp. PS_44_ISF1]
MRLGKGTALIFGEAGRAAQSVFGAPAPAGPAYGGPGGGGGRFEMDAAELESVLGLWRDQLDRITADGRAIEGILAGLTAPGADPASGGYVAVGRDSLVALQDQNRSMERYAQDYLEKLRAARDRTVAADQANADLGRAR